MKVAINGFGRIGRSFLRVLLEQDGTNNDITVACINVGPARIEDVGYMFQYDSIMGTYPEQVTVQDDCLYVGKTRIPLIAEPDPRKAPWKSYEIDWVVDCSGRFTKRSEAALHLRAGAQRVLISAPAPEADMCIIPGVNQEQYDPETQIIVSLGSCTTNAFFPMIAVLQRDFGIEQGFMTTTHAYTNSQVLLDVNTRSSDIRRSRSATQNIIPTTTGAAQLVGTLFPELEGKIVATALRVPIANVSLIDFVVVTKVSATVEQINAVFEHVAGHGLNGIVAVSDQPLVSTDYLGSPFSVTVDAKLTQSLGNMIKIAGWYDNEWGYSCRLRDFLVASN